MTVPRRTQPRKLTQGWWRGFELQIAPHALQRAAERLSERFGGLDRQYVAKMCAGAIYRPQEQVLVINADIDPEHPQVASPLCHTETGEVLGFLVLDDDLERPSGVIAKTWLDLEANQIRTATDTDLPIWYTDFRKKVESGSQTEDA